MSRRLVDARTLVYALAVTMAAHQPLLDERTAQPPKKGEPPIPRVRKFTDARKAEKARRKGR